MPDAAHLPCRAGHGALLVTLEPRSYGPRSTPGVWGGTTDDAHYTEVPAAYGRLIVGDVTALARAGMYVRATPYLNTLVQGEADFDDPRNREVDRFVNVEVSGRKPISSRLMLVARAYGDLNEYRWFNFASSPDVCAGRRPRRLPA